MKRIALFALALALLAFPAAAQKGKGKGRKASGAVQAQEDKWLAAVKANDLDALGKILADDLVYTHSTGIVETKTDYLNKLKSGDQKYANIEYSDIKTWNLGRAQVLSATVRMTGATKGVPFDNKLKMLHVWSRQQDCTMQLVAHQTTKLQ
jgi:ketosteroid isomerase-like protein